MLYSNGILLILCIIGLTACVIGFLSGNMVTEVAILLSIANMILGWIAACNIDDEERQNDR